MNECRVHFHSIKSLLTINFHQISAICTFLALILYTTLVFLIPSKLHDIHMERIRMQLALPLEQFLGQEINICIFNTANKQNWFGARTNSDIFHPEYKIIGRKNRLSAFSWCMLRRLYRKSILRVTCKFIGGHFSRRRHTTFCLVVYQIQHMYS